KTWRETATDIGESYDLVVVGGGISGLAAAYFFREAVGRQARILVLDNHDDFGGHAKRNEFRHEGRMMLLNGGTLNIEGPGQYSPEAMGLLRALGIVIDRFEQETLHDRGTYTRLGLRNGVWFNKERFGADRLVVGTSREPEFLAKTPLAEQAKRDIARIESRDQPDYMPGLSSDEKKQKLIHMSYQDFLQNVAKVHADAVWFYQSRSDGLFLMHIDALPAYYAWNMNYPGFQGMKLEPTPPEVLINEPGGQHGRENQARANAAGRAIHFPDGNATIARLLVRSLVADSVPGSTQEDVVTARANYARLDRDGSPVRIRLNSMAVNVQHAGDPASARDVLVTYVKGGRTLRVRGAHCVLACWNSVIPYICPELPAKQREALAYGIKAPIVYTSVLVRNWTAFQKLGVANITAPGGYHSSVQLPEPVTIGQYQCARTPEEPTVLHLVRTPCAPGKPRKDQHRLGREELLRTTFEQFEREIRGQLGRSLVDGGFDPARDIEAITVNRWPHGYTYNYNTLFDPVEWCLSSPDDRACVVGRKQFGRISIANADAAGSSHTDAAIDMAWRGVGEVVDSRTREQLSHLKR
ncbi:MAG TPA: NAD(P)-binding protein, partial [Vicinamibacterales bacterium]|nr:NAD(P)-binding protein [Vicinamibacterales bacterium]